MNRLSLLHLRLITHVGSLIPLALLIWDYFNNSLGFDPIREVTFRTGKTAIIILMLSLACTPVSIVFGYNKVITLRKPLGLYAFLYVFLHFLTFIALDYGLKFDLIWEATIEKRYALVGFLAFLILSALATTSNKQAIKKLGKRWKQLHRLVYGAGVLAVVHYIWLVKNDYGEPIIFATILTILLVVRVPPIRKAIQGYRRQLKGSKRAVAEA